MIILTLVVLAFITVFAYMNYRAFICPAVLHNVFWMFSLIGLLVFAESANMQIRTFLIIIVGSVFFQNGFFISQRLVISRRREYGATVAINPDTTRILVYIMFLPFLIVCFQYIQFIRANSFYSWYSMLSVAYREAINSSLLAYMSKIIQISCFCLLLLYWKTDISKRKRAKTSIVISFVMAVMCVMAMPTRNSMLFFLLPLMFIYLITHKIARKKVAFIFLLAFVLFMIYFYLVSRQKYAYLYKSGNALEIIKYEVITYLSGSILAFDKTMTNHAYMGMGAYSFRFFVAVFDKIAGTNNAVSIVNEFTQIGTVTTNVYTFYDFYLRDFGILYALIAQFIAGCLHGTAYKKMKRNNLVGSVFYALLMYPLIMQFFQDQYLSLFSTWIQAAIIVWLVLDTGLFKEVTNEVNIE